MHKAFSIFKAGTWPDMQMTGCNLSTIVNVCGVLSDYLYSAV
jgi:hypothetical protein